MTLSDYTRYDGLELAELIKQKKISPREAVQAAIDRITAKNPALNAVIYQRFEQALQESEQVDLETPFAGVPLLLKDLGGALAGTPASGGSRYCKNVLVPEDSELIKRFKRAGFIILGKTNCPEFGLNFHTEPEVFGPTHNPWNLQYTAGGSSGGAAAAVAGLMTPIAHANDGGGSIRVPASVCGLFGLKPSRGRVPAHPDAGKGWQGLAIDHALTRSVRDSAAILDVIAGADPGAPFYAPPPARPYLIECATEPVPLRIGLVKTPIFLRAAPIHSDCEQAVTDCVELCHALGHHVEEINLPTQPEELTHVFGILVAGETGNLIDHLAQMFQRKPARNELETITWLFYHLGSYFSAKEFAYATHVFDRTTRQIADIFTRYDILLTPTLAEPPSLIGQYAPSALDKMIIRCANTLKFGSLFKMLVAILQKRSYMFSPFTALFNITGNPAMSVPLFWNQQNLPIGMQFAAEFGNEALLFRLARQLEQARPWLGRVAK